ncbi:MAG: hypothetical protein LBR54_01350 [Oscillospiraceae bacterium]|nr:hypothetical protein [Oscillospiraceae bacterium]
MTDLKPKTLEEIAELAKNEDFRALAQEYLDGLKFCNEIENEICAVNSLPRITRAVIDHLLECHKNFVRAELELEIRGISKTDVLEYKYDKILNRQ